MDQDFNPYREWLGLNVSEPPDHYRLLGLEPFESDARRVLSACDGMLARVRSHRPGQHAKRWGMLLDELTSARDCLIDPLRKSNYDRELKTRIAATASSTQTAAAAAPRGGNPNMWPPGFGPPSSSPSALSAIDQFPRTGTPTTSQVSTSASEVPVASPALLSESRQPTIAAGAVNSSVEAPFTPNAPVTAPSDSIQPIASPVGTDDAAPWSAPATSIIAPAVVTAPAMPGPPVGMFGGKSVDPMAPVAGPVVAGTATPVAQPVGFGTVGTPIAQPIAGNVSGQSVPVAQPLSVLPQSQQPASPAIAASSVPSGSTISTAPVGAYPIASVVSGGIAHAAPISAQAIPQAMPLQAMPVSAASESPTLGLQVPTTSTAQAYKRATKRSPLPMIFGAMFGAGILVVLLFLYALKQKEEAVAQQKKIDDAVKEVSQPTTIIIKRDRPRDEAGNTSRLTTEMLEPLGTPAKRPGRKRSTIGPALQPGEGNEATIDEPDEMSGPGEPLPKLNLPSPNKPEEKSEEKADSKSATPEQVVALRAALEKALTAMGHRDWDTAQAALIEAETMAVDNELQAKLEGVKSVHQGALEFWNAVREGAKGLGAAEELMIGNSRVAVVEVSDKVIVLRIGGSNKRYPLNDLPMGLARTLADRWFDQAAPSTKIFTGAFLFVEPNGDPAEVRSLWQQAQQAGVSVDVLMPLLDDDLKAVADKKEKS